MSFPLGKNYVIVQKDGEKVAAVCIKPVIEGGTLKHFELCHNLLKDEEVLIPVSDGSFLRLKEGVARGHSYLQFMFSKNMLYLDVDVSDDDDFYTFACSMAEVFCLPDVWSDLEGTALCDEYQERFVNVIRPLFLNRRPPLFFLQLLLELSNIVWNVCPDYVDQMNAFLRKNFLTCELSSSMQFPKISPVVFAEIPEGNDCVGCFILDYSGKVRQVSIPLLPTESEPNPQPLSLHEGDQLSRRGVTFIFERKDEEGIVHFLFPDDLNSDFWKTVATSASPHDPELFISAAARNRWERWDKRGFVYHHAIALSAFKAHGFPEFLIALNNDIDEILNDELLFWTACRQLHRQLCTFCQKRDVTQLCPVCQTKLLGYLNPPRAPVMKKVKH